MEKNDTPKTLLIFDNLKWLDTKEAAAYLRLPVGSLRNMTSNGSVKFYKLQGRNRYLKDDLDKLLLSNQRGGYNVS
jgi:excisionase family DNA binding protein